MSLLPILSASLVILLTARLVALRLFPDEATSNERAVATCLFALALPIAMVRILGASGMLLPLPLVIVTACLAMVAAQIAGPEGRARLFPPSSSYRRFFAPFGRLPSLLAIAIVGLSGLALSITAAALLPIWAWDALSYHLPIVQDAIATAELREVPTHVPYVNHYPRHAALLFTYVRLLLPDDGLLDLAQLPFALSAVVSIAAIARRSSASLVRATSFGLAFFAIPLVSMQLATNYVDIAHAAAMLLALFFITGPLSPKAILCAGLSLGLLLGIKPTAPPAVLLLGLVLLTRSFRARRIGWGIAALSVAALFGGEAYLRNLIRHRNPIWPVSLKLGPIVLEGPEAAGPMFELGLPAPYDQYGWLSRLLVSLFVEPLPPIFDMRLGGFGPAFVLLVGLAVYALLRRGSPRAVVLLSAIACLATPAAHWLRYSLALPAVLLAAAASGRYRHAYARTGLDLALAALLLIGLARALPGFTGEGPSLWEMARMPAERRERAVVVDGPEGPWVDAKASLSPGEAFAYDDSLALPGRLVRADGSTRAVYLPEDLRLEHTFAEDEKIRFFAVRESSPVVEALPLRPRFRCPYGDCVVYERP